jgi:hypothetical protein
VQCNVKQQEPRAIILPNTRPYASRQGLDDTMMQANQQVSQPTSHNQNILFCIQVFLL